MGRLQTVPEYSADRTRIVHRHGADVLWTGRMFHGWLHSNSHESSTEFRGIGQVFASYLWIVMWSNILNFLLVESIRFWQLHIKYDRHHGVVLTKYPICLNKPGGQLSHSLMETRSELMCFTSWVIEVNKEAVVQAWGFGCLEEWLCRSNVQHGPGRKVLI